MSCGALISGGSSAASVSSSLSSAAVQAVGEYPLKHQRIEHFPPLDLLREDVTVFLHHAGNRMLDLASGPERRNNEDVPRRHALSYHRGSLRLFRRKSTYVGIPPGVLQEERDAEHRDRRHMPRSFPASAPESRDASRWHRGELRV
jgi:hypothetical protein